MSSGVSSTALTNFMPGADAEARHAGRNLKYTSASRNHDVVATFLADTPEHVAQLRIAVQQSDLVALKEISHYVKGAASFIDAHGMSELCNTLELLAGSGDLSCAMEVVTSLEAESARVCAALAEQIRNRAVESPVSCYTQPAPAPIGIVVIDDHPVVRIGLRNILQAEPVFAVLGEAADGQSAIDLVRKVNPDVVLLDLALPRCSGIEVLRQLPMTEKRLHVVLVVASIEKQQLVIAFQLGARGVVLKDSTADDLVEAIHAVSRGQYWIGQHIVGDLVDVLQQSPKPGKPEMFGLTPRELQVVSAIVEGCANKDIAQTFSITEDTVKRHLKNIFDKLGVSSRLELAMFAVNHNLVERS
jgi:two-component system, NarL family, nitrate/nitrite response regulator NarL